MSYRPKIKTNTSGGLTDFPLDAETVKGVDVVNTKQDAIDNDHKLSSDLVDDTNQSNKFVSATEKSNISKSLYHLGAFDSQDGETRQTWIIDLGSLNWTYLAGDYNVWYVNVEDIVSFPNDCESVASNYVTTRKAFTDLQNGELTTSKYQFSSYNHIIIKDSQSNYPKGILQYKLATPITTNDGVIAGVSLLPLDTNMANKIRQKVVDGLNLFDATSSKLKEMNTNNVVYSLGTIRATSSSSITIYGNSIYAIYDKLYPAGTYSIKLHITDSIVDSNSNKYRLLCSNNSIDGTQLEYYNNYYFTVLDGDAAFIFTSNEPFRLGFAFISNTNSTSQVKTYSNIMLVEANHPYPYEPYHASKHISDEEATLLKQEEEKCRNLLPNSKSISGSSQTVLTEVVNLPIGTYTIKASGGTYSGAMAINVVYADGTSGGNIVAGNVGTALTFTTTKVITQFSIYCNSTISNVNFMLNKGSEAKPYQEYKGKIMHEADVQAIQGAIAYTDRAQIFSYSGKNYFVSSNNDTPVNFKGNSSSTYIGFQNSSDDILGYLGVDSNNKPVFNTGTTDFPLALAEDKVDHSINLDTGVDLNTVTTSGFYRINGSPQNAPNVYYGQLIVSSGADTILQIASDYWGNIYFRNGNPSDVGGLGSWSSWKNIFTSDGGIMSGSITFPENGNAIMLRNNSSYYAGINYRNAGNEAVCFENKNSVTSWIFRTYDPTTSSSVYDGVTPSMQIKNQRVAINKLIPNGSDGDYNLDVNGTGNFSGTLYATGGVNGIVVQNASGGEASIKYDRGNNTSWASGVSGGNYYLYEAHTQQNAFYLEEGTQGSRGYIYGKQIATTDDIKWFTLLWSGNSTNATGYDASNYSHFLVKLTYGGWVICKNGDGAKFVYGVDYTTSSFYIFFSAIVCANTSAIISSYKYYVATGNVYKDSYTNYISEIYGFNL